LKLLRLLLLLLLQILLSTLLLPQSNRLSIPTWNNIILASLWKSHTIILTQWVPIISEINISERILEVLKIFINVEVIPFVLRHFESIFLRRCFVRSFKAIQRSSCTWWWWLSQRTIRIGWFGWWCKWFVVWFEWVTIIVWDVVLGRLEGRLMWNRCDTVVVVKCWATLILMWEDLWHTWDWFVILVKIWLRRTIRLTSLSHCGEEISKRKGLSRECSICRKVKHLIGKGRSMSVVCLNELRQTLFILIMLVCLLWFLLF